MESLLAHKPSAIALALLLAISFIQHVQLGSGDMVMQLRSHERSNPRAAVESAEPEVGSYSTPPSCTFKCSGCTPCMTVAVAVTSPGDMLCKPRSLSKVDYYPPEVWCCKCGGELYPP